LIGAGGVGFAVSDAAISDIGGDIADNSAALNGRGQGGVLYAGEVASIRNVAESITGNHASEGGVMWAGFQNGEIESVGVDICDNYAAGHGGVIYSSGDAIISKVERFICSNAAHNGNGGVIYADEDGEIAEAGLGICQNQAFVHGGVIFSYDGDVTIHGDSTKVTLNEARVGFGGVGFVNNENNSTARGSIDVGSGYVTGNSDAFSADPFSLVGRNVTGMPLHLDFQGAALPGNVDLIVEFSGSDGVANEFITPGPVVNVTSFDQGIELDFVVNVEVDGLPAYYYQTEDLDVEVLPYGLYQFHNIKLPSGSYRLKFQVVTGCGSGAVIAESEYTSVFNVAACQDPRPIQCPTDVIVAESDAFTCGAYVVVDDIIADPDCDTAEFSNDYNSVTVAAGENVDGSASDVYPVGSTEVLLTVSTSGLDLSCPVQIVVEDVRPFTSMTCPLPIEAVAEAGLCSAEVTVPLPTALDNCPVLFANNQNAIDDASGRYHGGVTEVEFTGYNNGPSATCTTTVTVHDHEAPVITCPASFNTTCENRDVFFQVDAVDNCVAVDVYPLFHEVSPLGGVLEGGVSTLVYEAADAAGNTAQCSFTTSVFSTYYRDADGDGYGDRDQPGVWACNAPEGWVLDNTDCNDFNADAFKLYLIDFDGDGFGDPAFPICAGINATIPESFLSKRGQSPSPTGPQLVPADEDNNGSFDCDDTNPFVHPSSPELCDGIDNNCNGEIDEADNCPPAPVMNPVPVPTPVDNPVPVFVDNPIPVPVPVPNPIPVPVPYVVTVPNDDINAVFSISISSASSLQSGVIALFIALALSFFA
jgi:predicted outer membrane repeat protein